MQTFFNKQSSASPWTAHSPGVVAIGAIGSALIAIVLLIWSCVEMNSEGFALVSFMFQIDAGTNPDQVEPQAVCYAQIISAVAMLICATLGIVAAHIDKEDTQKMLLCMYYGGGAILAVFMFAFALSCFQYESAVGPVAVRQGEEFCNASFHETLAAQLDGCGETWHTGADVGTCGVECQSRVERLKLMGGCPLLEALCHKFEYIEVGQGNCYVPSTTATGEAVLPQTWQAQFSESPGNPAGSTCQRVCDSMTRCVGYAVSDECGDAVRGLPKCRFGGPRPCRSGDGAPQDCRITSEEAPVLMPIIVLPSGSQSSEGFHDNEVATNWTAIPGDALAQTDGPSVSGSSGASDPTYTCYRKDTPLLIHETIAWSTSSAILLLFAGFIMAAASLCGCMMQYSLVTRRQGAKGAGALCSKMLCFGACAKEESNKSGRFGELTETDEDASE